LFDKTALKIILTTHTDSQFVTAARLSTAGCRAFPVTGACTWNDLPLDITFLPSLHTFKQQLTRKPS